MGMVWMAKEPGKYESKVRDDLRFGDGESVRIATDKVTKKKYILGRLNFREEKATLFGSVISFKIVESKGRKVYDIMHSEPIMVPISTITWETVQASSELMEILKNEL